MSDPAIPLKAVLFDLDGTLIDSTEHIIDCWQYTARTCLGREMTRDEIMPTLGRTLFDCFEEIAPGRSAELFSAYRARQTITHDTAITLVPYTRETLVRLREAGLALGIVTSKNVPAASRGLNLFDLGSFFDLLVTIEDTQHHKPDPEPLLVAQRKLGLDSPHILYVGDALVDIQAGKAAGVRTGGVTWGASTRDQLVYARPDYIFENMQQVGSLADSAVRAC